MGKVGRFVRLGTLIAIAGLLTAGKGEPPPEPCGDPGDQPEFVFGVYMSDFGTSFPLDEAACDKFVANAVAACHKAVSDCEACLGRVIGNLLKGAKVVCSNAKASSECVDEAKGIADIRRSGTEETAAEAHDVCDGEFAALLADACSGAPL